MDFKKYPIVRKFAMFLSGVVLLGPLYMGIHAPNFAIKRFQIPEASVDLFLCKMNSSVQMGYFLGILVATLFIAFVPTNPMILSNISVGMLWLCSFSLILVLFSYVVNGEPGAPTFFYSMVTLSCFLFSGIQGFAFSLGSSDIHWYAAAIPFSGFFIVAYQLVFLYVSYKLEIEYVEFWIIVIEISLFLVFTMVASALWTACFITIRPLMERSDSKRAFDTNFIQDFVKSRRPIIMTAVGLGWLYICYPAIMPFKLANINTAYRIDLLCVTVSSVVSMVVCLLSEFTTMGPNKNWAESKTFWKYLWFCCIPYLLWPIFFVLPLHYPELRYSKLILNSPYFMGFLGIVYLAFHSALTTVGYSACPMQTYSRNSGLVSTVNTVMAYFIMNVVILYSQGYLRLYAVYSRSKADWPTNDMNWFSAMFYWIGKSFVYGWKGFSAAFAKDFRHDILNI